MIAYKNGAEPPGTTVGKYYFELNKIFCRGMISKDIIIESLRLPDGLPLIID